MKNPALLLLVWLLTSTGAWAQQGGGPGRAPRAGMEHGNSAEHPSRGQREALRTLIRQQPPSQREEEEPEGVRRPRQLSPEERMALRDQLRQQRGENWRRPP